MIGCEGLQFPCSQLATCTIPLYLGLDCAGAPVVTDMHLCDSCLAEWQSWHEDAPSETGREHANPPNNP